MVEGELCDLRVVSLGWTPGAVTGVVESECVTEIEEQVELQTVAGHTDTTETTVMNAAVTAVAGTVTVGNGVSATSVPFVQDGESRFTLTVAEGEAVHSLAIKTELEATLSIPVPPLTQLTHQPERTEHRTKTVSLWRPGTSRTVSETVTVTHHDGTTTQHVVTAVLSIPGQTVYKDVTLTSIHPERVDGRAGRPRASRPCQARVARHGVQRRLRRRLRGFRASSAGARRAAGRADAGRRRPSPLVRRIRMGVAVVRRALAAALIAGAALVVTGAAPEEEEAMLHAFDRVLTAMAYAASGPLPLRHRLGGLRPDGRGERGAGRRQRQDRR